MKTDTQIQGDVIDELRWDASTRSMEIGVAAKNGVVTLSGAASNYAQKHAAVKAAERVVGVAAVADDIEVKFGPSALRSDTDVAHATAEALQRDTQVPANAVKARVDNGWVTLDGETEWNYQRSSAERAVRNLWGVKGVTNLIRIKPTVPSTAEVSRMIKAAIQRSAESDADRIIVDALDGRITLLGKVRTWSERQDAERAAWSAPGVREVVDQITIGL
jgi:osmotically-inducible protein OsmY